MRSLQTTDEMMLTVLVVTEDSDPQQDMSNHHMYYIIIQPEENHVRRHVLSALERRLLENVNVLEMRLGDLSLSRKMQKRLAIEVKSVKNALLEHSTTSPLTEPERDLSIPDCLRSLLESEQ